MLDSRSQKTSLIDLMFNTADFNVILRQAQDMEY